MKPSSILEKPDDMKLRWYTQNELQYFPQRFSTPKQHQCLGRCLKNCSDIGTEQKPNSEDESRGSFGGHCEGYTSNATTTKKMHVYCEEEEAHLKERNCDHDANGGCRGNFKGLD